MMVGGLHPVEKAGAQPQQSTRAKQQSQSMEGDMDRQWVVQETLVVRPRHVHVPDACREQKHRRFGRRQRRENLRGRVRALEKTPTPPKSPLAGRPQKKVEGWGPTARLQRQLRRLGRAARIAASFGPARAQHAGARSGVPRLRGYRPFHCSWLAACPHPARPGRAHRLPGHLPFLRRHYVR